MRNACWRLNTGLIGASAAGINHSDHVVGTLSNPLVTSFFYSAGSVTPFNDPAASSTFATGINNIGQIVGFYTPNNANSGTLRGFLDPNGVFTEIGGNSTFTQIYDWGINSSGEIVGSYGPEFGHFSGGFLCLKGVTSTLNDPAGSGTLPFGINDAGQVVGQYYGPSGSTNGFLYSGGTFTTLDDPNGVSTTPRGINNGGQIVGTYTNSAGQTYGFLYRGGAFTTITRPATTFPPPGLTTSAKSNMSAIPPPPSVPEPRSLPALAGCLAALLSFALRRKSASVR